MASAVEKKKHAFNMTQGAIIPVIIRFTLPILFGNLFQLLYNTVDSIIVGNYVGTAALAAVGACTPICSMLVRFFNGISVGAGVLISYTFGSGDKVKLRQAVATTMTLTYILCAVLTLIGVGGANWMLHTMRTPDDVFAEASAYLRIYFGGITALLIYNMGSAVLRAVGDSRRPLYFLIMSSFLNIILDLVMVIHLHLGIRGAGYATVLSQFIAAGLVMYILASTEEDYRFRPLDLHLGREDTIEIFRSGLPTGIQSAVISFSNVFVQTYVNVYGAAVMAGWSCYNKLDQFVLLPTQSLGQAITTFTSQNRGAKQYKRVRKGTGTSVLLSLGFNILSGSIIVILASSLVSFFTPDPEVIGYGAQFLRLCVPFAVLTTFPQIFFGTLRGEGKATVAMIATITSHVIVRQIYLFIISRLIPGNVYVLIFGYPFGWIINMFVAFGCYYCLREKLPEETKLDEST